MNARNSSRAASLNSFSRSCLRQGWRWVSDGKGSFTIEPAANVPRGLRIMLHIREGDEEYLDPQRIRMKVRDHNTGKVGGWFLFFERDGFFQGALVPASRPT